MSIKSIIIALPFLLASTTLASPSAIPSTSASASSSSHSHNVFLGCTDPLATPIRPLKVTADSAQSCVDACAPSAGKNTFAYWLGGEDSSCVCSSVGPTEEYDIAYPREGLSHCDDHEVAVFVTKSGHTFQHQPKRASSKFRKSKRSLNIDIESRDENNSSCPNPLKACQVQNDSKSFQCIDPQFAITSCGGCIHGDFGGSSTLTSAVDCTKIEGVAEGGVICSLGQCKAYRCLDGYKLADGNTCVKA
ncbi:uncharacterized protein L201_003448 [Kwoniella dendrophila CBS 6074]|uniref:Protein CPL1-like domain-containing protein n=1 Tax=Kwoniella dendrophila CBS 6074 TaxID=1295534 RepID=A0AAX4JSX7_9TREE